jgi:16S rRNA (uracil1498-N3)-methyltransferase
MSLRVFAPIGAACNPGAELTLEPDESRYLARVRRARVGADVDVLTDTARWSATVTALGPPSRVQLGAITATAASPPRTVILAAIERTAMQLALRDATALGATRLIVARFDRSQSENRFDDARAQRLIDAARRQCGRPDGPDMVACASLENALDAAPPGTVVFCDPGGGTSTPARDQSLVIVVGPEGGLTSAERDALNERGAIPLSLGQWVLRAETAVAAALARLIPTAP